MTGHLLPSREVAAAGRSRQPRSAARPLWEAVYALALVLVDALAVTVASALALVLRFNDTGPGSAGDAVGTTDLTYAVLVVALTPAWVGVLALSRAYEARLLGVGSEEFKRVTVGSMRFLALVCILAFVVKAQLSRGYLLVAVALGTVLLLLSRFAARKVLHGRRLRGQCLHRVVAVGSREEVASLLATVRREPYAGLSVVGVALPDYDSGPYLDDAGELPSLSPARTLAARLPSVGADTEAVVGTSALSSRELQELAWDLEGTGTDLVVAPSLTDVAGPRIHVRPVAGLPLLHVEEPTFGGIRRSVKGAIDYVGAFLLLVLLLPAGLLVALAIKRDSPGPVFYRQERVGRGGEHFRIWKFRTMRVGADRELAELSSDNERSGPLFKMKADPRVTRVGAHLRRLSLDEVPQLINVLSGHMSLVGPRPPLRSEVDQYDVHVHRRLLVKPGMTGLWQVSGRSDLDWDETVRLDLYYVENWSVALDAMILWKTVFEVVKGRGAY